MEHIHDINKNFKYTCCIKNILLDCILFFLDKTNEDILLYTIEHFKIDDMLL